MKKKEIIQTLLVCGVLLTGTAVFAQGSSPQTKDTATYRLKTKSQTGEDTERVLYKDGEKIIIKKGESSPFGTSQWETDEYGNEILVMRKTHQGDSANHRLILKKEPNENGEKVLYKNGEKIIIKEGESSPFGEVQKETDAQGNEIVVMRKTPTGDTTSQRLNAYKRPGDNGDKVLYKDGKKQIIKSDENRFEGKGEWETDEHGKKVLVIREDSNKVLYIYQDEDEEAGKNISDNRKPSSTPLNLYPNPTPGICHVVYDVENSGKIRLELVNQEGKIINTLLDEHKDKGTHTLTVDVNNFQNGIYFIRYTNNDGITSKRLLKVE